MVSYKMYLIRNNDIFNFVLPHTLWIFASVYSWKWGMKSVYSHSFSSKETWEFVQKCKREPWADAVPLISAFFIGKWNETVFIIWSMWKVCSSAWHVYRWNTQLNLNAMSRQDVNNNKSVQIKSYVCKKEKPKLMETLQSFPFFSIL